MATPFIQLGQCGNQVGCAFFDKMFQEGKKASQGHQAMLQTFFTDKNVAKAFLIDMEPKVVNKNLSLNKAWSYTNKYSTVKQEGSGNNWAYGCFKHGNTVKEELLQKFYRMFEQEDYIKCLFQIQSMAGGTGSGLGSFIVQLLGEYFPEIPKFNICVMPHLSGEVILQSYNLVLSLSSLYQQTDGIILIQNDEIQSVCTNQLKIQKCTLDDINTVIGRQLASILFPVINKNTKKVYSIQQNQFNYASDIITHLVPDPRYKLISVKSSPNTPKNSESFNSDTWNSIINQATPRQKIKSKGSLLIARGPDHPDHFDFPYKADTHVFNTYPRSATLLQNNQDFVRPFQQIIDRCTKMAAQKAFLYQYQKYDLNKEQFVDYLAIMQNIQSHYQKMD